MNREQSPRSLDERRRMRSEAHRHQSYKTFLKIVEGYGRMKEEFAERAAVAVLCALERRLTAEEASDMEAQLPLDLQKLLFRCARHEAAGTGPKFGRERFFEMVAEELNMKGDEVEPLVRAVFSALQDQVSEGEIDDVKGQLPREFEDLWQRTV